MKYLFFGTPEFAAIILEKLIDSGFIPEAVICNPDRPVGRKKIITPPPVKQRIMDYESPNINSYVGDELGIRNKIKILQPEKLDPSLFIIPNSSFDLFIVASYSQIIPKEILAIPRLGSIGVHPSLLPKYRGPSPIQSAILNGDEITGTTLFLMDEKVDHGPILAAQEWKIPNFKSQILNKIQISKFKITYEELLKKLAELSTDLLIKILPNIEEKIKNAAPQNESDATYTKKFKTEDAFIKPEALEKAQKDGGKIAIEINRKIRALNPEPGTWTLQQGLRLSSAECPHGKLMRIKLLEAEITQDGKLKLKKIQTEGKKPKIL